MRCWSRWPNAAIAAVKVVARVARKAAAVLPVVGNGVLVRVAAGPVRRSPTPPGPQPTARRSADPVAEMAPASAGVAVLTITLLAVVGPLLGLSPWLITVVAALALGSLTLDAARFGGRGGHLLAESLPGGQERLRRIAIHEAGHALAAAADGLPVRRVLVGSLACLRAGLGSSGSTEFEPPASAKLPLEELRRWSRVLQAGMAAETILYSQVAVGGADDRALLGRLWGLSGHDVATAQREQRRARREVEQLLRGQRQQLELEAARLVQQAPRLGHPSPAEPLAAT